MLNNENLDKILKLTNQRITATKGVTNRVIQFGTGVLLRGLPDYYIDQANRKGIFNGSIIMIKSTSQGDINDFIAQNNLYTIQTEGIQNGKTIQEQEIVSCISAVLSAQEDWSQIITLAEDPNIEFIISNTTESGIIEVDEDLNTKPISYPGRLTALLYRRFIHFEGSIQKGYIILPTELIDNNADNLKEIVISIATKNQLPRAFINWIDRANHFCNTLVDRIVPGKIETSNWLYQDNLAIAVEPFNLWAIETKDPKIKKRLSFAKANSGIRLTESIQHIKELKLRLLNATHTLLCPIAILSQHAFVRESLHDLAIEKWTHDLMETEITQHLLTKNIDETEIYEFASSIIDRFKNPFIDHKWLAIAQNSTQKWKQRIIPILQSYNALHANSSKRIALSMAAYIKCHQLFTNEQFPIELQIKNALDLGESTIDILGYQNIWSIDLSTNTSFAQLVSKYFNDLDTKHISQILN